jgi:HK97 gp10 family phage protein
MPVVIEGMAQALRAFQMAPKLAREYISGAVRVTEILLAGRVRSGAPVRTGALRLSINSKTTGLNASISIEEGELYGQRPSVYWRWVEFGSLHNVPARPFIRPAAEQESEPYITRIKDAGKRMERALDIF